MRTELNASLAALAAEVDDLVRLLAALPDAAWERPTSGALAITVATLEALLGGPRPTDLADNVAFVEAATGRRPHPDPRLPLLG